MSDTPRSGIVSARQTVEAPAALFTSIAAEISEIEELQTMIAVFRLLHDLGGPDHPLSHDTIEHDRWLRKALRVEGSPKAPLERIEKGLSLAAGRGTLLRFAAISGAERGVWYYLNTIENAAKLSQLAAGFSSPPAELATAAGAPAIEVERPNVFRLYEQNVGLLTPLVADRIVSALERYPVGWIEDAISEAVSYNHRSWRYIQRILENWAVAGRGDAREAPVNEDNRRGDTHVLDPNQYRDGRYLDRTGRG